MQLSAGGGRDSTAPTKPTKSTDRTDGSEGDGCVDSAGGTLSTGATSACISFCCSPSTVEELQRGRRAARGLKSIGVQRSRLLLRCVFYICPSQGGGKHFYHHLGFGQNRALQGRERDKTALWVQNTHNVTEDKKSECIKAHSVFVHTEEDTGRTNSADSRISLHSSGSTSVRTAAADTRELMLGSQHQLSSAQPKPAGPGRGQKTRRGKHFSLSTYEGNQTVIIIRKNRLIHELNDSQTSSNLQPYVLHSV